MGFKIYKFFLTAGVLIAFGARLWAADTNAFTAPTVPDATNSDTQNALLQIQEQLRTAQLSLAEDVHQSQALTARIDALEQSIATQHAADVAMARRSQQWTLALIAGFGLAALGILSLMVYFQWKSFLQLAEISARQIAALPAGDPRALPVASAVGQLAGPGRVAVESSNARLLGAVEQLEKRILELEHDLQAPLAEKKSTPEKPDLQRTEPAPAVPLVASVRPAANGNANGKSQDTMDREECIANLFAEGLALMNAGEAEKALECYEVALRLAPKHAEALVKKGAALEKLGRLDEAIICYDQAIESDNALTVAYLQKGGLFNRLARYDEALLCYERALQTQEKKSA
jgi:tetratricopeptide (TPR) repeat protein